MTFKTCLLVIASVMIGAYLVDYPTFRALVLNLLRQARSYVEQM